MIYNMKNLLKYLFNIFSSKKNVLNKPIKTIFIGDYISKEYKLEWYNVIDDKINTINNPFYMIQNQNTDQFLDDE